MGKSGINGTDSGPAADGTAGDPRGSITSVESCGGSKRIILAVTVGDGILTGGCVVGALQLTVRLTDPAPSRDL